MKTKLITISMMLIFCTTLFAQRSQNKIGYIDMDYILDNISDYSEANSQLNQKIQTWKGEIDLQQQKIRDLKEDLENERPLLTQDLIDERQDEIEFYQKKMQEYQQQRFGPEGDMIAQRRQIMQPIQDEVFNAVQEIGEKREYDFIFDSSADALMLFSASRHDISDQILGGIRRHSRKLTGDNKSETKSDKKDDEQYKSVIQDRLDKEKEEERETLKQEKIDERQATMDERQEQRDSTRAARQAEFQARRDSIQRQRNEQRGVNNRSENSNKKGKETNEKQNQPAQENIIEDSRTEQPAKSEENSKTEPKTTNNQEEDQQKEDRQETLQKQRQDQKENLKAEREAQRDSIKRIRQESLEKRQKQRDSVIQARNLERKNRNK